MSGLRRFAARARAARAILDGARASSALGDAVARGDAAPRRQLSTMRARGDVATTASFDDARGGTAMRWCLLSMRASTPAAARDVAARSYSKKKKQKQRAAAASDEDGDEDEDGDGDGGEEGDVVEYDAKEWQSKFDAALHALDVDLSQLRTARASAGMIDHIIVDVYGEPTPLSHLGTITAPNAQTLSVTLFDPSTKPSVEKAIVNSPLGFVPKESSDGLIVPIPAMTQDTRKEVCKLASKLGETAKIAARNIRHKAQKRIKRAEMSEDDRKRAEKNLQALTDDIVGKITQRCAAKEKEIMTL